MAYSVTILGIPVGCNLFKFKTWLKQKFEFNSEINFRRLESNNSVELIISDVADFTRIQQEEFDYSFGNQNFKITFICSDFQNTLTSGNLGPCPPSQHSIHLLNIPDAFNNYQSLRERFERFGQIKRIHLQKRSKTSATITYVRESDARKVISEGATLDGIPLNIIWDVDEAFALNLPTIGSVDTGSNLSLSLESLIPAGKRCLLIIPESKNTPNLKELIQIYFASEVATGGGNIAHLQPVVDGWLLEYESEITTDRVLQRKRSISLEGHLCLIFERVIPSYYTDRIKLSGISANTAFKTQQLLLAKYSRESSNKEILCSDIHWYGDHCIVLYEGNTNINVYNLVEKIDGEIFRETPLKAELLQQTNCVEVSNITSDVNSDDLKSLFNNQRQCENEAVTLVQRVSDNSAVVHFATHSVAEKVVRNAAMRNLTVKLCKVVVRLYYREITETNNESLETTLPTERGVATNHPSNKAADESNITLIPNAQHTQLKDFIFECVAHPDVLAYFNYTGQLDSIKEKLECAEYIQAKESETGWSIIITPKENLAMNQAEFEQSCKEFIENQLGLFNHEQVTLDPATIDFLKETKSMTPTPGITSWLFENRKAQFFFRLATDSVELTGLQEDVSKACDEMKSMKLKEDKIGFNTNHGRKFLECGCFGKIQEKYKDSLVMKFNTNSWELHIRGEQTNVTSAKLDAEHIVKNLEKCKVELEGYELEFLKNILKDRAFEHVRQEILDCLKEKGILVSISMKEDTVYLHFVPGSASGKDELKQLIAFKKLVVQNNEVLKTSHWEKYLDSLNDVLFQVMLPRDEEKTVILVGFRSELDMAKDMVLGYIDKNEKLTKTVMCSYPAASYLKLYDPLSSTKLKNVKWVINFKNGGGIEISGTRKHLKEAETWITERTNSYAMITHDDHTPGFADHFRSESSEKELELIQSSNKCLILLDHNDFSYYNPDVENSLPLTSDIIKGTEVKMNVYKGNISKHRCDVVVVPAGKTLDTESNPTLTAVAKKVGEKFKQELSKKSGNLKIGEVIPIPCDHQSGFKQVVLAVVPSWREDKNPANLLTTCVVNSLKAADECKATSVAFPALCCGNGGADLEKCISIILKGCIDYVKNHKKSTIKQLDFVEIKNNQVLEVFKREVKKHSKVVKATQSRAASAKKAVQVSTHLVTRSITNQMADVIVNSTNTETLHKVGGSKLAEAISQAAGPELQEECHKLAESQPKSGTIVETGAYNLPSKKVYHILLDPYNQNNGPSINEAIKQCLKLATKSKFTSISFPAVGCGAFGFPPTEVAKRIKEEIKKIQGHTTLENIYINLHPSDTQNIQAFRNIFGTTNPSGKCKFEHLQVTVTHGNIVTEQCDVLINSISEKADLNASGPLSKEISEQGGNVVQTQFKDMKRKHASSTLRVTDGGNLPCHVIVHGATEKIGIQQLVFQSLQIAEDLGKSSVAIPALGTGNMGRGERDSAEEIRRGIIEFDQTKPVHVKHVKVVVYQGKMLSTFQSVMSGRVNQATNVVANIATITLNSLRLEVYQGDVTTESGDVLVNNVLQNMDITGAGPLSNAIVKVAGNSIVQEFRNNTGKHGYNHISVTAAGALSYDKVIHVGFKPHLTGEMIKDALKVAEKLQKNSVVFPAIGTSGGQSASNCAVKIRAGIDAFNKEKPVYVKLVKVVVFKQEMLAEFQKVLLENKSSKSSKNQFWNLFGQQQDSSVDPDLSKIKFHFCALDKETIDKTQADLQAYIQKVSSDEVIEDEIVERLDASITDRLKSTNGAEVKIDKRLKKITIKGVKTDVIRATQNCLHLLDQFKVAEMHAEQYHWVYRDMSGGDANPFMLMTSNKLEMLHTNFVSGKKDSNRFTEDGLDIAVDFTTETAELDGVQFDIYRVDKSKGYPEFWRPMKSKELIMKETVLQNSQEYNDVLAEYRSSGAFIKSVIKLERLQNKNLFDPFAHKINEVRLDMQAHNSTLPVTRRLFHGTSEESCKSIFKSGFDCNYAGKHATKYGKGNYFAVNATYCHNNGFSKVGAKSEFHIFLAEVVTGQFAKGEEGLVSPPSKPDKTSYHSVVDNVANPTMFIVFRDACVYPHYLLTYR